MVELQHHTSRMLHQLTLMKDKFPTDAAVTEKNLMKSWLI